LEGGKEMGRVRKDKSNIDQGGAFATTQNGAAATRTGKASSYFHGGGKRKRR